MPSASAVRCRSRTPVSKVSASISPASIARARARPRPSPRTSAGEPSAQLRSAAVRVHHRGDTRTSARPASTISGYTRRPISASPPAPACSWTWQSMAARAAALSGWKYAEPWSPSITVTVPPGRTRPASRSSAAAGSGRCSRTKHTNRWSNEDGSNGGSSMSAWHSSTLARPASSTRRVAAATRLLGDVDRRDPRLGAARGQRHGLRADAAAGLQHGASGRVRRVAVQQLHQRAGLVGQPLALALAVAVDVLAAHGAGH